ncbi:hypothetical protein OIU77_026183 [Salix suchowensis]|uniref:Prolyl endopeptidase n=1 Tax=Salix suchowensis TaxID=1278906 RepID=A0ABQ9C339_9ROSI|nr:hypothetical protein OIU77_026183 [Salix suchowensis]
MFVIWVLFSALQTFVVVGNMVRNGIKQAHLPESRIALMTSFLFLNTLYLLVIPNQRSCASKEAAMVGFLFGACINQRPDLFGCALAHVGVMDMLRFHKFTIGHAWTSDYGCSDKKEEFGWLIEYSPLHNVRRPWEQHPDQPSQYPPTMILTADHDDRVVPLHSLKLLATMQYILCTSLENSPQTNPIIGRIECKAGHGAGRPTQKMIDEAADRYGFMARMLGASWNDIIVRATLVDPSLRITTFHGPLSIVAARLGLRFDWASGLTQLRLDYRVNFRTSF